MENVEKRMEKKLEEIRNLEKIMQKKLEEGMDKIVNLIQHTEERPHNGDNVGQGTHHDRNNSHF